MEATVSWKGGFESKGVWAYAAQDPTSPQAEKKQRRRRGRGVEEGYLWRAMWIITGYLE